VRSQQVGQIQDRVGLPKSVNSPVTRWTSGGIGVPILSLEKSSTRRIEATSVSDGSSVVATQGKLWADFRTAR